jgi:ATP-dependent Clp protease ATP-binding subunit ClpB
LGRSLESLINRGEELKAKWKDSFVSIEELVMAMADDARFGADLFRSAGISKDKLEAAIMEIRGGQT